MDVAKQTITPDSVGNRSDLIGQISYINEKRRGHNLNRRVDPRLLVAIIKRKTADVESIICSSESRKSNSQYETLSNDLFKILQHAYGNLLEKPIMLAMKLASSETTETTKNNEPTRLDVLHCLATHYDELVSTLKKNRLPTPNLNEILEFGRHFKTTIPLHTFILGLPEHRKNEAAELINTATQAKAAG